MGEQPKNQLEQQVLSNTDDSYFALDPDNLTEVRSYNARVNELKTKRDHYRQELEEKIAAVAR